MILWTIMPEDIVLRQPDEQNLPQYEEIEYDGTKLMIEKMQDSQCRVVRILSSDPRTFLRPEFQPGSVLTYRPC